MHVGEDVIEGYVIDNVVNGSAAAHPVFKRMPPLCCRCCGHGSGDEMRITTVVWGAAAVLSLLNAAGPRGWMLALGVAAMGRIGCFVLGWLKINPPNLEWLLMTE